MEKYFIPKYKSKYNKMFNYLPPRENEFVPKFSQSKNYFIRLVLEESYNKRLFKKNFRKI